MRNQSFSLAVGGISHTFAIKTTIGLIGLLLIGLVSVRKEGKVQEAGLLLQNVEALATGESFPDGEIACFGDGSVDCPFTYLKVEVVYREE